MHFSFFSLYPLLVFGFLQQIYSASNDAIFEGVAKDDKAAIKSVVESDLSMLVRNTNTYFQCCSKILYTYFCLCLNVVIYVMLIFI